MSTISLSLVDYSIDLVDRALRQQRPRIVFIADGAPEDHPADSRLAMRKARAGLKIVGVYDGHCDPHQIIEDIECSI